MLHAITTQFSNKYKTKAESDFVFTDETNC